jgi:hypothetical protein
MAEPNETDLLNKIGPALDFLNRRRVKVPESFTTEYGVVLKLKKVPATLLTEAIRKLPKPAVPIVWDEKRQREIPNENSTAYLDELEAYQMERAATVNIVYLGFGTELVSVPDGVARPDDDWDVEWIEIMPQLSFPPKGTKARYVSWVRNVAMSDDDHGDLLNLLQGIGPVAEAQVQDKMESFRGDEPQHSDNGASTPTE